MFLGEFYRWCNVSSFVRPWTELEDSGLGKKLSQSHIIQGKKKSKLSEREMEQKGLQEEDQSGKGGFSCHFDLVFIFCYIGLYNN